MTDSNAPLRAIVVGTGFGCRIQVPALRGAGFDVQALVGADAARTAERARANGVPQAFADLDQAISATDPAVVAVSAPPHAHAALTLKALERGCHVLCEKPFAANAAEARAMLQAAERAGKVHVLGNEFRFLPHRATVARAIAEGLIGEPRFATFVQHASYLTDYEDDQADWWFDPAQGGGWLGAHGAHMVDLVRTWLGEFAELSAALPTVTIRRGPVEDAYSLRFRTNTGVEGVVQQCGGDYGPLVEITRVVGSKGAIWLQGGAIHVADRKGVRELSIPADLELPPPPPPTGDPRHAGREWGMLTSVELRPYAQLCRVLKATILGEASPSAVRTPTFADGVANMQVFDAIRASARSGGALTPVG